MRTNLDHWLNQKLKNTPYLFIITPPTYFIKHIVLISLYPLTTILVIRPPQHNPNNLTSPPEYHRSVIRKRPKHWRNDRYTFKKTETPSNMPKSYRNTVGTIRTLLKRPIHCQKVVSSLSPNLFVTSSTYLRSFAHWKTPPSASPLPEPHSWTN